MNKAVKQALAELEDAHGRLTPEQVVRAAREKSSPLHDLFDWDSRSAAHKYRLDQARTLIRSVKVTFMIEERAVKTVAYVHDPELEPKVQGYRSTNELRKDADMARAAIMREFGQAGAHLKRARDLASFLSITSDIDELMDRVTDLRRTIESDPPPAAQ